MQLAALRYFLEVAQCGSVRKAADCVNITPSAVSRHIAILERMIDASLFERRPRGMVLTQEGQILHKYAQRMVSEIDLIKSAVEEIRGLRRGIVKIAAIEAVATNPLFLRSGNSSPSILGSRFRSRSSTGTTMTFPTLCCGTKPISELCTS